MKKNLFPYVELFLAALTWASLFLFIKELEIAGIKPVELISIRFIASSIIVALIAFPMKVKLPPIKDIPFLLISGVSSFVATFLISMGEKGQNPDISGFMFFSIPTIFSLFVLKKLNIKLTHIGIISLVASLAGLAMIGFGDTFTIDIYFLELFLGACSAGVYFVIQKFIVDKHGPYVATCFAIWGGLVFAVWFLPSVITILSHASVHVWLLILGITFISTIMPIFFFIHAMRKLGPGEGTTVNILIPFIGNVLALIFAGYAISELSTIGGIISTVGVIIYLVWGLSKKESKSRKQAN